MTIQEQNIAIHEYLGWEKVFIRRNKFVDVFSWKHKVSGRELRHTPYYTKDLNAIHKAEKVLTWTQTCLMHNYLDEICERPAKTSDGCIDMRIKRVWQADAAQRTEAFLKTIEKWKKATI